MPNVKNNKKDLAAYRAALPLGRPHPDRARQFMPFSALKGYYKLVQEQEREVQEKRELTPEKAQEISQALATIKPGNMVQLTFYDKNAYITRKGVITNMDCTYRKLTLVRQSILFDDIYTIQLL